MSEYIKWLQILSTEEGVEKYREVIGCWNSLTRVVNKDLKSTLDENISAEYEEQSKDENEKLESQKIELKSERRKLESEIKEQSEKETEKKLTLEAEEEFLDYLISILEKFNNRFELRESELKFIEDRDVDETKEKINKIKGEIDGIGREIDEIEEEINEIDNKIKIINLRKILRGKKGVNAMGAAELFDVIYSKVKGGKFKIEYGRENKQVNGIGRKVIVKPGNVEAFLNKIEKIRGVNFLQEKTIISLQKVADNIYEVLKPQLRSWVNDCYD